jgi:hypothetical protein
LAERKHIGIIVLPRKSGTFDTPAQCAANSFDAVRRHRFPVAGTAEHHAAFKLAISHGERNRTYEEWIVNRLFRISAKVNYFVIQPRKKYFDFLLVLESSVV